LDLFHALILILKFVYLDFALIYTADKLAQIAILATGFTPLTGLKQECFTKPVYSQGIYEKLFTHSEIEKIIQAPTA